MNILGILGMLKNPSAQVMQMAMQQMIQADPKSWQMTQEKFGKLNKAQAKEELQNMYGSLGADLNEIAAQCGIAL